MDSPCRSDTGLVSARRAEDSIEAGRPTSVDDGRRGGAEIMSERKMNDQDLEKAATGAKKQGSSRCQGSFKTMGGIPICHEGKK
jgi:hypothetical protein